MYYYAFCKYVHIAQTLLYTIGLHVSLDMLADCATPSVQVNKSSLVVHGDQEGGKTCTPRRREYYYYLCTCKCTF